MKKLNDLKKPLQLQSKTVLVLNAVKSTKSDPKARIRYTETCPPTTIF